MVVMEMLRIVPEHECTKIEHLFLSPTNALQDKA